MHLNRVLKANFWKSLIAVVAGNVLYMLTFSMLPEAARHRPFKLDLGLAVDLWFCLFFYGLVELFLRLRHKASRSS